MHANYQKNANDPRQVKALNLHKLNQAALKALKKARVSPDPSFLHVLQLMLWALDNKSLDLDSRVNETVRSMSQWSPEEVMKVLTGESEAGDRVELLRNPSKSPVSQALELIGQVEERMIATARPDYASNSD